MARKREAFAWDEAEDGPFSQRENTATPDDPRIRTLPRIAANEEMLRDRARTALAGTSIDEASFEEVVSALQGLSRDLDGIKGRMIEAGRRLLRITRAAGASGYRALFRAGLVPVSEATASKLRRIAEAVETGRIPVDHLPAAIRTAYYATTLPPESIGKLIDAGVLRPEATVREIDRFLGPKRDGDVGELTVAERRRLTHRLESLEKKVRELRRRLGLPDRA
jgi:hypothetical protein